jgi:hypothetical protein
VIAVEQDPIRFEALRTDLVQRATRRTTQRFGHAERVALLVRRMTDTDCPRPRAHLRRGDFALLRCEHLRIAHALEVFRRRYERTDRDRPRPGAATDFVEPDDDLVARLPQLSLDAQRRLRRRGSKRGHARGSYSR